MNKKITQSAETCTHTHTGNLFLSLLSTLFVVFPMLAVANTVELHWYDNDTELRVPTTSQSCEYGGHLMSQPPHQGKVMYSLAGG